MINDLPLIVIPSASIAANLMLGVRFSHAFFEL
jgi:hypothetical protein